jgi:hypothetical protein
MCHFTDKYWGPKRSYELVKVSLVMLTPDPQLPGDISAIQCEISAVQCFTVYTMLLRGVLLNSVTLATGRRKHILWGEAWVFQSVWFAQTSLEVSDHVKRKSSHHRGCELSESGGGAQFWIACWPCFPNEWDLKSYKGPRSQLLHVTKWGWAKGNRWVMTATISKSSLFYFQHTVTGSGRKLGKLSMAGIPEVRGWDPGSVTTHPRVDCI